MKLKHRNILSGVFCAKIATIVFLWGMVEPPFQVAAADWNPFGNLTNSFKKTADNFRSNKSYTLSKFVSCEAEQLDPQWCWAACTQMVLRYHDQQVTQEEIVHKTIGSNDVQTAGYTEISRALRNRDKRFARRKTGASQNATDPGADAELTDPPPNWLAMAINEYKPKLPTLVDDLSSNEPCVVGLIVDPVHNRGHACIVYGVEYHEEAAAKSLFHLNFNGKDVQFGRQIDLKTVKVFDPAKGAGETNMAGADFNDRLEFVLSDEEACEVFQNYSQYQQNPAAYNLFAQKKREETVVKARAAATTKQAKPVPEKKKKETKDKKDKKKEDQKS